jgi:hypothetical protein
VLGAADGLRGLLALVKFLDLLEFEGAFAQHYVLPRRGPKLGDYRMVLGILLLLFIGFLPVPEPQRIRTPDHTVRIARLKMLYAAAKIRFHGNRDEVLYSVHEQRAAGLMDFLGYLDRRRKAAS